VYRLYIDESGDHTSSDPTDVGEAISVSPARQSSTAICELRHHWTRRHGTEGGLPRIYEERATLPVAPNATFAQKTLTSKHIKLKPKALNVAGLQLADVLAHPVTRDVLRAYGRISDPTAQFPERVMRVAVQKYNHHLFNRRIDGYGRVILA
jgi:hypothetical protein